MSAEAERAAPNRPGSTTAQVTRTLEAIAGADPRLNAFITLDIEGALEAAAACDARQAAGVSLGPFDGVIVAIKDCLDTAGLRTTRGSALYANRVPDVDAAAVANLREAGAIIIAKTNLTELSCGTIGYNAHFGFVANPVDADFYPGGSSSGSAAAIGAGLVDYALGTDTSCSIRVPAAFCGVVGLKPTFDRVAVQGNSVIARTLDHVGPMATDVKRVADLLAVIQRDLWPDPTASIAEPWDPQMTVGVLNGPFLDRTSPAVAAAYAEAIAALGSIGVSLRDVTWTVDLAEADGWANLLAADMVEAFGSDAEAAPGVLGADLVYWLERYRQITADEYAEARGAQERIRAQVIADLAPFDLIVCPTVRHGAQRWDAVDDWTRQDRVENCSIWAFTGHPALSVPWGTNAAGMPLGLQVIGRHGQDEQVLRLGLLIEQIAAAS